MNTEKVVLNGREVDAVDFTSAQPREKAIVDLSTLLRVTSMLKAVPLRQIREDLVSAIRETATLENMVQVIEDEAAFHRSVNLINTYSTASTEPNTVPVETVVPGQIN